MSVAVVSKDKDVSLFQWYEFLKSLSGNISYMMLGTLREYLFRENGADIHSLVRNFLFICLVLLLGEEISLDNSGHPLSNLFLARTKPRMWMVGHLERSIIDAMLSKWPLTLSKQHLTWRDSNPL